jgi:hypothetical protein
MNTTYFANLILLELTDGDATGYEDVYTSTDPNSALLQINGTNGVTDFTEETSAESAAYSTALWKASERS